MDIRNIKQVLFLDIETVSCTNSFDNLHPRLQALWKKKAEYIDKDSNAGSLFFERAGIYAEFGKIICISFGSFFHNENKELCLKIKSLSGENEHAVISDFKNLLERFNQKKLLLCAHNGKEFDFPYLCRRMLVNSIELPDILKISGKKPWEVQHLDTLELWKFGDKKNYTSLDLLTALFDIPSSKNDFDGSMVNECYYKEKNIEKIVRYCEKDVEATAQLFLRFKNLPVIPRNNIIVN